MTRNALINSLFYCKTKKATLFIGNILGKTNPSKMGEAEKTCSN